MLALASESLFFSFQNMRLLFCSWNINFFNQITFSYFFTVTVGRERLFKPASAKIDLHRGFVGGWPKVAQIRPRQISGTRSELNLLDQVSHSYDTPPIHKSKSEWIITPEKEATPFRKGKHNNRYDKSEPIYATPSLPSLTSLQVNSSVHQNEHYYSIPCENYQYEMPIKVLSERKTSRHISQQGKHSLAAASSIFLLFILIKGFAPNGVGNLAWKLSDSY